MKRMRFVGAVGVAFGVLASNSVFAVTPQVRHGSNGCGGAVVPLKQHAQPGATNPGDSGGVGGVPLSKENQHVAGLSGDPHSAGGIPSVVRTDPRSVGGIPYSGSTGHAIAFAVPHALTVGLIINSSNSPVTGAPVLILSSSGAVIAAATTDDAGAFALNLPKVPGLTLALPSLNVFDIPVTAGDPLLILIP